MTVIRLIIKSESRCPRKLAEKDFPKITIFWHPTAHKILRLSPTENSFKVLLPNQITASQIPDFSPFLFKPFLFRRIWFFPKVPSLQSNPTRTVLRIGDNQRALRIGQV